MARAKRQSYRDMVANVALNDEPTLTDVETVADLVTTQLLAEAYGVDAAKLAHDIIAYRAKHDADWRAYEGRD
jgi:hypothetical protein